jgi:hypothetical protein
MRHKTSEAPRVRPKIAFGRSAIDLALYFGVGFGPISELIKRHPDFILRSLQYQ